ERAGKVELLARSRDLRRLQAELTSLRDVADGENPVKQVADMGMTDNAALEGAYGAVKAFSNALKKSDHAVSVNMRAATGSQDQSALADTLKAQPKNLEHGDDEIGRQRSYWLNLTSPFTGPADKSTGPWPHAGDTRQATPPFSRKRSEGGET
ncbi:AvrE-family type 3 secretion system effector, partial [Pseudomonas syringae]